MKIGMYMTAFREPALIKPAILQWLPFKIDRIIVAASEKPWFGGLEKDNTADLARETGVEVIEKYWKTEGEQRNEMMDSLQDCDWIIHWFPDQFLTVQDRFNFIQFIKSNPVINDIYSLEGFTYWKNFHTIIEPRPRIKVLTKNNIRFENTFKVRGEAGEFPAVPNVALHHFQWAKTKRDIISKSLSYGHATDFDPNWVENVWSKSEAPQDFHPISRGVFKKVSTFDCPQEIISLLDPEWVKEVENG